MGGEGKEGDSAEGRAQSLSLKPGLEGCPMAEEEGSGQGNFSLHGLSRLCLHSMQELREEMRLLAFDLQDNNRIIER